MADFLVTLADFDRRRAWVELGHSSLFYFLHRELGLSKGAAHYRQTAAKLVRRFPEIVEPLRDGRLCITSIIPLAKVLTPENRKETLPKFFQRSKREAMAVAAAIQPATAAPHRDVVTAVRPTSAPYAVSALPLTEPAGLLPLAPPVTDPAAPVSPVTAPAASVSSVPPPVQPVELDAPPPSLHPRPADAMRPNRSRRTCPGSTSQFRDGSWRSWRPRAPPFPMRIRWRPQRRFWKLDSISYSNGICGGRVWCGSHDRRHRGRCHDNWRRSRSRRSKRRHSRRRHSRSRRSRSRRTRRRSGSLHRRSLLRR